MKSIYARGVMFALAMLGLTEHVWSQERFGAASLLPIPSAGATNDNVAYTAYNRRYQENIASPSDVVPDVAPANPMPAYATPTPAPQYQGASVGGGACNSGSCNSGSYNSGGYAPSASTGYPDAAYDGDCGDTGGYCGPSIAGNVNRWYGYAGGLILNRAGDSKRELTQNQNSYITNMSTGDADQGVSGGFEGRIGRLLGCGGCNALEVTYWGLFPQDQMFSREANTYPPAGIGPLLGNNLQFVDYDDGTVNYDLRQWMTTSTGIHAVDRSWDYNNVEINFLGNSYAWGLLPTSAGSCCGPRLQYGWLAGFRYFNFSDTMIFSTDYDDTTLDGDSNELKYAIRTRNNLFGFQIGGQGNYAINNCWSLFGSGRGGVYNNHITSSQYINGSNGDAVIATGDYAGTAFRFNSTDNALAAIGQIDLGIRYNINCRFSIQGGYRVVGIAGVATAPDQVAQNFVDPRYIQEVKADEALLLHGAFVGGTFMW